MHSVFKTVDEIQQKVKTHLSLLEPRIKALPMPAWVPSGASAGQLIVAAKNHRTATPTQDLRGVRQPWTALVREQTKKLDDLELQGIKLRNILDYVEHGSPFPENFEHPHVAAAARALFKAREDGHAIQATIDRSRRHVAAGLAEVARVRRDVLPIWKSTADIIIARHSGLHYKQCAITESDPKKARDFEARSELMKKVLKRLKIKNHARAAKLKARGVIVRTNGRI